MERAEQDGRHSRRGRGGRDGPARGPQPPVIDLRADGRAVRPLLRSSRRLQCGRTLTFPVRRPLADSTDKIGKFEHAVQVKAADERALADAIAQAESTVAGPSSAPAQPVAASSSSRVEVDRAARLYAILAPMGRMCVLPAPRPLRSSSTDRPSSLLARQPLAFRQPHPARRAPRQQSQVPRPHGPDGQGRPRRARARVRRRLPRVRRARPAGRPRLRPSPPPFPPLGGTPGRSADHIHHVGQPRSIEGGARPQAATPTTGDEIRQRFFDLSASLPLLRLSQPSR